MRNWLTAFRPASFRGLPFKVDVESVSGGRRLSIHPIAYADQSVIEDMGRDPHRFAVTAYVAGDAADAQALAFAAALAVKGAGALMLPMRGPVSARVASWSWSRQKDYAGHVAFDVEFVEAGLGAVPFNPIAGAGALSGMIIAAIPALAAALRRALTQRDAGALDAESSHAAAAGSAARAVAALATPEVPADLAAALSALDRAALPDHAAAAADAWRLIGLRADPVMLMPEASVSVDMTSAVGTVTAVCRAAALAIASVRADHVTQAQASAARDRLAGSVAAIMPAAAALGDEVAAFLAGITGRAATMLSAGQSDRAPMAIVETDLPVSAIRIAYDLYGDARTGADIARRVAGGDPVFLPMRIEVPAP